MGNCFSDPSSKKGGQKLGSAPAPASTSGAGQLPAAAATANGGRVYEPPRTLGGTGGVGGVDEDGDPRARAMRAAEERANAVCVLLFHLIAQVPPSPLVPASGETTAALKRTMLFEPAWSDTARDNC